MQGARAHHRRAGGMGQCGMRRKPLVPACPLLGAVAQLHVRVIATARRWQAHRTL